MINKVKDIDVRPLGLEPKKTPLEFAICLLRDIGKELPRSLS